MMLHSDWKILDKDVENLSHISAMLAYPIDYYAQRLQKIGFQGKNTKILDAACGSGIWAFGASKINKEVQAIDLTPKYLAVAQKINLKLRRKNLYFKTGKIEELPYKDNYFDFIVCYNAWMYTKRQKSLAEMNRVLKPGGKIYLGCIAGWGYYLFLTMEAIVKGDRNLMIVALKALKNRVYMTKKESRRLLENQGFDNIKIMPMNNDQKQYLGGIFEVLAQKKGKNEN